MKKSAGWMEAVLRIDYSNQKQKITQGGRHFFASKMTFPQIDGLKNKGNFWLNF